MLKRDNLTVVLTFDLCCVSLYFWHYYFIKMLLHVAPCGNNSHFELHNVSSLTVTHCNTGYYTQGAIVYKKLDQYFFFRNNEIFILFLRPYCPVLVLISTYIQLLQPWVDYSSGCSPWCFSLYGKYYPVSKDTKEVLVWMDEWAVWVLR